MFPPKLGFYPGVAPGAPGWEHWTPAALGPKLHGWWEPGRSRMWQQDAQTSVAQVGTDAAYIEDLSRRGNDLDTNAGAIPTYRRELGDYVEFAEDDIWTLVSAATGFTSTMVLCMGFRSSDTTGLIASLGGSSYLCVFDSGGGQTSNNCGSPTYRLNQQAHSEWEGAARAEVLADLPTGDWHTLCIENIDFSGWTSGLKFCHYGSGFSAACDAGPIVLTEALTPFERHQLETYVAERIKPKPLPAPIPVFVPAAAGGAITGSSTLTITPAGALNGSGALAASTSLTFTLAGALDGTGTLAGSETITLTGSGTVAGKGAVAAAATLTFSDAAALKGTGALAGASTVTFSHAAALSGLTDGAISAAATLTFSDAADLKGLGELVAAGTLTLSESADLDGTGQLAASVSVAFSSAAALDGTGTLEATATITFADSAALDGTGDLAASAAISIATAAALQAAGTLTPRITITGTPAANVSITGTPADAVSITGGDLVTPVNITEFYWGEPITLTLLAKDPDGTVITTPASQTIKMTIGRTKGGTALLDFDDKGTLEDAGTGEFTVALAVSDYSSTLTEGQTYYYSLWSQLSSNDPRLQKWGKLVLGPAIAAA